MYGKKNLLLGVILGAVGAVVIFCLAVAIGCSINGISFGQQIVEWFGEFEPVVEEVVDQVVETTAQTTPGV